MIKTTMKAIITLTDSKGRTVNFTEKNIKHIKLEEPGGKTSIFTQEGV